MHRDRQRAPRQHTPAAAGARSSNVNFSEIVGDSAALRCVLTAVDLVAPTDATVLLQGETGTGKELLARVLHHRSARRTHPFVTLNCAAIPTGLLESELFGHERGAFTGAMAQRLGRFELAHRGTLFLDEIGDLPLELQPKLLRVLQEHAFERLGSSRTQQVDVRVVAATNADLAQLVAEKRFRSDLYYRLNVFPIVLPPLRERREDIPPLVRHFVQHYAQRLHKRIATIPASMMTALVEYPWPGNIRELQNVVERAVILCESDTLAVEEHWLQQAPLWSAPAGPLMAACAAHERALIEAALSECRGRVSGPSGAAAKLGLPRQTLASKIKALGIPLQQFKTSPGD
jgi:formate hydrogenlyase transcriptional activator